MIRLQDDDAAAIREMESPGLSFPILFLTLAALLAIGWTGLAAFGG